MDVGRRLPPGKIPPGLLRRMLASVAMRDPAVLVGGAVGEDAAVIDTGGPELLVAKTDPVTLAGQDAARYLLAINSNDVATTGAEPRWLLVTALLPEGVSEEEVERIFEDLKVACSQFGVTLAGGHTEMTARLERTILVGCLLGTVPRERLLRKSDTRPGDAILLAGGIAIEGTAILAVEHAQALAAAGVKAAVIARAAGWLDTPGISVLPAARVLRAVPGVHAMHDPTEGGLITALHELGEAAGAGVRFDRNAVPVLPECAAVCAELGLDPLGLLASGALLATLDPGSVPTAIERLRREGLDAAQIGEMVAKAEGEELPIFARDELTRYLSS